LEDFMRSIVRRTAASLGAALCLTSLSSVAFAEPSVHVAASAAALRASSLRASPAALLVVDHEARARGARARVSSVAGAKQEARVATTTERFGDGETIVRVELTHHGLPVRGRGAAVRLTSRGDELVTAVDLEHDLPSVVPSLASGEAATIAARRAPGTVTADDAHLVVWPLAGGGSRLAYAILPRIPAGLPMAPRIIVDAHTGKILESRDMLRFAKATVYETNPTKSPTLQSLDLALTPDAAAAGKLTNAFVTSTNCIDHKSVKDVSFSGLKLKVHVCDLEQVATADVEGNYVYPPSDVAGAIESRTDNYGEVSMYYHSSKAYEFFRTLQGVPDAQVVVDKPLRVIANLQIPAGLASGNVVAAADPNTPLETFQNAFFSPAGGGLGAIFQQLYGFKAGALWFGQGPQRDYAYDGDVVYHEFTHAVVDATLKLEAWHIDARGAVDSPGAMNEGLADYFSSAITGDPDVGEYASKDISSGTEGVIRTLANPVAWPLNLIGEVHSDSTLFSGALWQARASLPEADRNKFDAALYKAMRTNPGRGDLGYDDLAKLFLATLGTDLPAGATALTTSMTARGVLPSCDRVVEPKNGSVKAVTPIIGGFASPGLQSVPQAGDLVPGIIQVHAKPAATDVSLAVSFTAKASSGSANPLGGGGTPYTPVALVKFGKAITWTVSRGAAKHDADKTIDMTAGTRPSATFEIPEGTTDVFVQIANKGDTDGAYDNLTIELTPAAAAPIADPVADPMGNTPTGLESDSGCGCSTPGHAPSLPVGGLVAALAVAAGVVRRRRR
jgi:MYXO-CTERM domain-containing protein